MSENERPTIPELVDLYIEANKPRWWQWRKKRALRKRNKLLANPPWLFR